MEEIYSKCCTFFKCGKLVFKSFLKVLSFKVKVFGREFFQLLKTSTFKFENVCCSFCVQNVFFSNGVLESHEEV